ncbi:tyrosine-type recombinase/integrase [Clostridium sp.]|uniref:tyrosine-type recombinase/integrase n=1 Tax=Clostridium sp. TaxID=1506 RepID=UPI003D6D9894
MINALTILGYNTVTEYQQKIEEELSIYTEKFINADGSVNYKKVSTSYFIDNDKWNMDFFDGIEQFKKQCQRYKYTNKNIYFKFNNPNINTEIKFIFYHKVFNNEWSFATAFVNNTMFKQLSNFINEKYPTLNSILNLDKDKANFEWVDWLVNNGTKTICNAISKCNGKEYSHKMWISNLLNQVYKELVSLADTREEWHKDIWDVRNLEQYGIGFNKSKTHYFITFTSIKNKNIRKEVKRYFKQRLLCNNKFSTGNAVFVLNYLCDFINYISQLEPTWNDFKNLERKHIEMYIEWLNSYTKNNLNQKNADPLGYKLKALNCILKFLSDIQIREYEIAPVKNVRILIYPEDKPTIKKKPYDQIDYVPDYVLEQLFNNINNLNNEIVPVVWVMYKTGLRISDVLGLKQDCLIKINNKFWVEADIEKTYVKGHRIPIDDALADILAFLIHTSKQNSNQDNNPQFFIFNRYTGIRKGRPYSQTWIQDNLNAFARKYNITDELGNLYHFKNHAFRHTYAIKMLNGGADILTVQELLAHASPEMTMRYAKLLDDNKRKVFDNVIKQGVFSFNVDGKLSEETNGEIPKDILDMLWANHKLNAIDTPYGTCFQRSKGKCTFAKQPPCLTCNAGKPCKDLGVGNFEGDVNKYEIHINSTKALIEQAKKFNRKYMVKENEDLLNIYEEIFNTIKNGNTVYGRLERLI